MKMYIWTKNILTQYSDGIAVAVAENEHEARSLILQKHYKEIVAPNITDDDCDPDDWPINEGMKLQQALQLPPDIQDIPYAVYEKGGA